MVMNGEKKWEEKYDDDDDDERSTGIIANRAVIVIIAHWPQYHMFVYYVNVLILKSIWLENLLVVVSLLAGYGNHIGGFILSMKLNKQESTVNGQADETDKQQHDNSKTEMGCRLREWERERSRKRRK